MALLSYQAQQVLHDVEMLGSFSPQTFHISLATDFVSSLDELPEQAKQTLSHEFGHLIHYLTSYLGLKDLSFWIETINVLTNPVPARTPEEVITWQYEEITRIARGKQILSIDDAYYFEPHIKRYPNARANPDIWSMQPVLGRLFKVNGELSDDHYFWALRFFVGSPSMRNTFMRIPIGMRTLLEHMAKAIDFLSEIHEARDIEGVLTNFIAQSYEPQLLHYYCLSHWTGPMLERKYGEKEVGKAFILAGQLVLLISIIPFDEPDIWESLRKYAKLHLPSLFPQMVKPHPSFLFPILIDAAEKSKSLLDSFNIDHIVEISEVLLHDINLPQLSELESRTRDYADSLISRLDTFPFGAEIQSIVKWAEIYIQGLSWGERLSDPMKKINKELPIPVVFKKGYCWEGEVISLDYVELLADVTNRQNELLRFPYSRNIVS